MSENYESILEAAQRLPAEQQRRLAEQLLEKIGQAATQKTAEGGKVRRHFGAWDSGDERSADNERIDLDLAREYKNSPRP
jgi:hypothetical protein